MRQLNLEIRLQNSNSRARLFVQLAAEREEEEEEATRMVVIDFRALCAPFALPAPETSDESHTRGPLAFVRSASAHLPAAVCTNSKWSAANKNGQIFSPPPPQVCSFASPAPWPN